MDALHLRDGDANEAGNDKTYQDPEYRPVSLHYLLGSDVSTNFDFQFFLRLDNQPLSKLQALL